MCNADFAPDRREPRSAEASPGRPADERERCPFASVSRPEEKQTSSAHLSQRLQLHGTQINSRLYTSLRFLESYFHMSYFMHVACSPDSIHSKGLACT